LREEQFISFLEKDSNIESKDKAVKSRISKARRVEGQFHVNLDVVVRDDQSTFELLKKLRESIDLVANGSYGNAVRKYYKFVNQKDFPTLAQYQRRMKFFSY
jgi:hypothetical protein